MIMILLVDTAPNWLNDHILEVGERKNMEALFLLLPISIGNQDSRVGTMTRLHARPARFDPW
jgi:hypothetical protein